MVKVVWKDVAGEAVPAIEHIEQMCQTMH